MGAEQEAQEKVLKGDASDEDVLFQEGFLRQALDKGGKYEVR